MPAVSLRDTERERTILERIRAGIKAGEDDVAISEPLNRDGVRPCWGTAFTARDVKRLRHRHQLLTGGERLRRGERPPG
jgi:hypothetical protein